MLFLVTGTVDLGDELLEVVDESEVNGAGVVEMLLAVIAVRHKQIASKTESADLSMLAGLH